MSLYEVAMIQRPTKKEAEEGAVEKLVFGPKAVIAKDQQSAGIAAVLDGEKPAGLDMSKVEVIVRPFA